jgi:hypothetical protein
VTKDNFNISFPTENTGLNDKGSVAFLQMAVIIFCKEPLDDCLGDFKFINYLSSPVEIKLINRSSGSPVENNLGNDISFGLSLSDKEQTNSDIPSLFDQDMKYFSFYNSHSFFISFVALNNKKRFLNNSQTLCIKHP